MEEAQNKCWWTPPGHRIGGTCTVLSTDFSMCAYSLRPTGMDMCTLLILILPASLSCCSSHWLRQQTILSPGLSTGI